MNLDASRRMAAGLSWDHNNNGSRTMAAGLSWDHNNGRRLIAALTTAFLAMSVLLAVPGTARADETMVSVIVREAAPDTGTAEALVENVGGTVDAPLDLIGGFTATVPSSALSTLLRDPAIASATPDAALDDLSAGWDDATDLKFNPATYDGTVNRVAGAVLQAPDYWDAGFTGQGIDVALIDSGVVPVDGLTYPGKVINGPDLSFESQIDDLRYLDTFGHGTHMAGIIAGRDDGADVKSNTKDFLGVAPGSRIVSIKVAGHDGATDVSQVIAAIDWVVQHKNDDGMNIRVLNLSYGTDSVQSYQLDPLAFAVEQAWKAGIVVVVAAGNDGNAAGLRNPATNPYVVAVGATNAGGTRSKVDDVLDFSNCGTTARHVDLVVPGKSITSLRAPGSAADEMNPDSVVAGRYMLGSGTSQAAAFVSGTAALILSEHPEATPDQVKALLMRNAQNARFTQDGDTCFGSGLPNMEWIRHDLNQNGLPAASQTHAAATGVGSLEEARGSDHVEHDGEVLDGEQDIFGNTWDGASWSSLAAAGASWSGGEWNGASWSGASWSGASWSGASWSGASWSGASWSGLSWSWVNWLFELWSGASWSGESWSGASWSGLSWSGLSWSGASWSGGVWHGNS
jgi:serine protease AprX